MDFRLVVMIDIPSSEIPPLPMNFLAWKHAHRVPPRNRSPSEKKKRFLDFPRGGFDSNENNIPPPGGNSDCYGILY